MFYTVLLLSSSFSPEPQLNISTLIGSNIIFGAGNRTSSSMGAGFQHICLSLHLKDGYSQYIAVIVMRGLNLPSFHLESFMTKQTPWFLKARNEEVVGSALDLE